MRLHIPGRSRSGARPDGPRGSEWVWLHCASSRRAYRQADLADQKCPPAPGQAAHGEAKSRTPLCGLLLDIEQVQAGKSGAEQRVYANELFDRLSPFAQSIVNWRWLGYSWREIARQLEMDHTAVRRAYFRELDSVLGSVSRSGDSSS